MILNAKEDSVLAQNIGPFACGGGGYLHLVEGLNTQELKADASDLFLTVFQLPVLILSMFSHLYNIYSLWLSSLIHYL